jgi:hypothetical protein
MHRGIAQGGVQQEQTAQRTGAAKMNRFLLLFLRRYIGLSRSELGRSGLESLAAFAHISSRSIAA